MTFSAGRGEVGGMNRRRRVCGRFDIMNTVAAGAVGDFDVPGPDSQAVETACESLKSVADKTIFFRETHGSVAGRADLRGDILRRDRRFRIRMFQYAVFAVALNADRRIRISAACRDPVDALRKFVGYRRVTSAAGFDHMSPADGGGRISAFVDGMAAVTIGAGGRGGVSRF